MEVTELKRLFPDLPADGVLTLKIGEGASLSRVKASLSAVLRRASPDFLPEISVGDSQAVVRKVPKNGAH